MKRLQPYEFEILFRQGVEEGGQALGENGVILENQAVWRAAFQYGPPCREVTQ